MKVGIIADMVTDKKTGVGNYACRCATNLFRIDCQNTYTIIHYSIEISKYFDYKNNLKFFIVKKPEIFLGSIIRKLVLFPRLIHEKDFDIVHDTYQLGPLFIRNEHCLTITTVHDLVPVLFSEAPFITKVRHRIIMPVLMRRIDKIIADSNSTKQDIISIFNIPEEKIKVIHLAADEQFKPLDNDIVIEIKQKYNVNFPFILYVGTLEPRKNITTLIKAFYELKKKNLEHKLVIAGKKGWKYKEIFETINNLNLQNEVKFTGYVPDEDLPGLYNGADLFVYPSLYEGFGLPPLEAMACGIPVITSNTSSLPEVVGNAGIMVDPLDVNKFAYSINEVLTNGALNMELRKKGLERAKMFSWEKCARETLKVYEGIYNQK